MGHTWFFISYALGSLVVPLLVMAQSDWVYYGQDPGGMKYSTLKQINTSNVANLQRAWTFHTGDNGGFFSSTPLVVSNVMYFTTASGVYALEADTGKQLWKYDAQRAARRGVSYWPGDGQVGPRILANIGTKMVALENMRSRFNAGLGLRSAAGGPSSAPDGQASRCGPGVSGVDQPNPSRDVDHPASPCTLLGLGTDQRRGLRIAYDSGRGARLDVQADRTTG